MKNETLETMGNFISEELDDVEFIGVQIGHNKIPSLCAFNCKRTGGTFLADNLSKAKDRLLYIRENFRQL